MYDGRLRVSEILFIPFFLYALRECLRQEWCKWVRTKAFFFFHYFQPFIFYHFFDYVVHPDTSLKEITVPFFDSPILLNLTYEFRFDTVASLSSFAQIVFLLFFFCNFTVQYIRFSSFCLYIPLIIIFYSFPFFMMQNANSDVLHYKKKVSCEKRL